uniref:Uncharacterized protein n=1 Tax=Anguilla anguilla TaxID=7936 RepID=A0A0E9WY04_ANGAN
MSELIACAFEYRLSCPVSVVFTTFKSCFHFPSTGNKIPNCPCFSEIECLTLEEKQLYWLGHCCHSQIRPMVGCLPLEQKYLLVRKSLS